MLKGIRADSFLDWSDKIRNSPIFRIVEMGAALGTCFRGDEGTHNKRELLTEKKFSVNSLVEASLFFSKKFVSVR